MAKGQLLYPYILHENPISLESSIQNNPSRKSIVMAYDTLSPYIISLLQESCLANPTLLTPPLRHLPCHFLNVTPLEPTKSKEIYRKYLLQAPVNLSHLAIPCQVILG